MTIINTYITNKVIAYNTMIPHANDKERLAFMQMAINMLEECKVGVGNLEDVIALLIVLNGDY